MTNQPAWEYQCTSCGQHFCRDEVRYLCPDCADPDQPGIPLPGVLEVIYNYPALRRQLKPSTPDWSLLSPVESRFFPPYPAGCTPLLRVPRLEETTGFSSLWVKNDGQNPSGSLKDRASLLVVAEANRLRETRIVTASTGNAASALAAVCAAAGCQAIIFVPRTAPPAKLIQMRMAGARVLTVDGSYDDAFALSLRYTAERGGLNRNTAFHPFTIEGKKTAALEIFSQLGGKAPDAVLVPTGDGVILAGVWKGFSDLLRLKLIPKLPRLVAVQAESSDSIHHLAATGTFRPAETPSTIADSISVSTPSNAWLAVRAIRESGGFSITVTDEEIRQAQRDLASRTGIFAEPAAAASLAGLRRTSPDQLDRQGLTVLLITGHGLKDPAAAQPALDLDPPLAPGRLPPG